MRNFSFGSVLLIAVLSVLLTAASISFVLGAEIFDLYRKVLPISIVVFLVIFLVSFLFLKHSNGEIMAKISDLDPQKEDHDKVSSELKPFLMKLEEQEQLRRNMYSDISHEMKTPLTTIRGYAELMENGMVPAEDIAEIAGKMNMESQHLLAMIDRVLESTKKKDMIPEWKEFDMLASAKAVADRLGSFASQKNISVVLEGEAIPILSDEELYEQICYNLIENSIKYTPENGRILISVSEDDKCKTLLVSDNGIGISDRDRNRVFERFFRGDPAHSRDVEGSGLGLSIVKHHADVLGAEIFIDSRLGKGTVVKVIFTK